MADDSIMDKLAQWAAASGQAQVAQSQAIGQAVNPDINLTPETPEPAAPIEPINAQVPYREVPAAPTPDELQSQYQTEDMIRNVSKVPGMQPWSPEVQVPYAGFNPQREAELAKATAMQQDANAMFQGMVDQEQAAAHQQLAKNIGQAQAAEKAQATLNAQEAQKEKQAAENVAEQDKKGAQTLSEIFHSGSWGQKLGMALSILVGGISQGLMHAKENPVTDFLEKADQQILANRKLKAEEVNSVRKAMIDQLELQLKVQKQRTDDALAAVSINKALAETAKIKEELRKAQMMEQMGKVGGIVDPNVLDKDLRKAVVTGPDGKPRLAYNEDAANGLRKYMSEVAPAMGDLQELVNFTKDKRFYNPYGEDKARVETKIAALQGALRLAFLGPGPMTDTERKFLIDTLGDPSKFWSLKANQLARLDTVMQSVNRKINLAYKQAGINLDEENDAQMSQSDRLAAKGISPERQQILKNFLIKQKQSNPQGK